MTTLRLSVLVTSLLFATATSAVQDTYDVRNPSPPNDESAVPVGVRPSVDATLFAGDDSEAEPRLRLVLARDGSEVSGTSALHFGDTAMVELVPDSDLAPDADYLLILEDEAVPYRWHDDVYDVSLASEPDDPRTWMTIGFTTRSAPRVRSARYEERDARFRVSFTQEIDPASVTADNVYVLSGERVLRPPGFEYQDRPIHELAFGDGGEPVIDPRLVIGEGVVASDGTPVEPLMDGMPVEFR